VVQCLVSRPAPLRNPAQQLTLQPTPSLVQHV
jgi:hypothetical protein